MIDYLKGTLQFLDLNRCTVEVGGIGYRVFITRSASSKLPRLGQELILHIYHHIREGEQTLYGFSSPGERELFERLIGISGIGPRLALAVLNGLDPVAVQAAVLTGDSAAICGIKGVGKKTAQRIILELKDKLNVDLPDLTDSEEGGGSPGVHSDVLAALISLGFSRGESLSVLTKITGESPAQGPDEILRECVALLGSEGVS